MRFIRPLQTASVAALVATFAATVSVQAQTAAPSATPAAPAAAAPAAPPLPPSPNVQPNGDWVATLRASGHFNTLIKALDATQLSNQLKAYPNLTVFAPTDEAFNALPPAQLQYLLAPANLAKLQKVLIYHVVNAPLDAAKVKGTKTTVGTVDAPQQVTIDGGGDTLLVNNADVIQTDVKVANGVTIFVLDKVLIPPEITLPAAAASAATAPATGG